MIKPSQSQLPRGKTIFGFSGQPIKVTVKPSNAGTLSAVM